MRISDWSSDVCSSDLLRARFFDAQGQPRDEAFEQLKTDLSTLMLPSRERALALDQAYLAIVREQSFTAGRDAKIGSASCGERGCQYVEILGVAASIK